MEIATLCEDGLSVLQPPRFPDGPNRNYVVCCPAGDYSGFLSWPEVLVYVEKLRKLPRPPGYFGVEER